MPTGRGFSEAAEVRWMDAASEVSHSLMLSGPDAAWQVVAREALRAARGTLAAIVVPAAGEKVAVAAVTGDDSPDVAGEVPGLDEPGLWLEVCLTGLPVVVDDLGSDPRAGGSGLFGRGDLGPLMLAPLVGVGGQLAVLGVGRHTGSAPFTAVEVEVLSRFARHVALSLRFARVYAAEQRRRVWLDATMQVTGVLLTGDPAEALDAIVTAAGRAAGAQQTTLSLAEHVGAPVVIEAADGTNTRKVRGLVADYSDKPLFAEAVANRQVMTVDDPTQNPDLEQALASGAPAGPLLVAPLFGDPPRVGCLAVWRPAGAEPFTSVDVEMATLFAAHAALTLRFTRMHDNVQQQRAWLESSTESTTALLTHEVTGALETVAKSLLTVAQATVVAIVIAQGNDTVYVASTVGPDAEDSAGHTIPIRDAPLFRAVNATDTPLLLDEGSDNHRADMLRTLTRVPVGPILAFPLTNTLGPRGALIIGRAPGDAPFTPTEIDLARDFTAHATLTLRFIRLHDDDKQRRAWLESSTESMTVLMTHDVAGALETVTRSVLAVTKATVVVIQVAHDDGVMTASSAGLHPDNVTGRTFTIAESPLYRAVNATGTALLIDDAATDDRVTRSTMLARVPLGPVLALPLPNRQGPNGALIIGRPPGDAPFTPTEIDPAKDFAAQATLTLRFAQLRAMPDDSVTQNDPGRTSTVGRPVAGGPDSTRA